MHCILNHDGDWSGAVRIAWYMRRDPGPTPPSLHECWCSGPDLVAGLFTPVTNASAPTPGTVVVSEPPVNILTRAVALAVEDYLRFKLERVLDVELFIRRGKL